MKIKILLIAVLLFSTVAQVDSSGIGDFTQDKVVYSTQDTSGISTFLDLTDTPSSYTGQDGLCLKVDEGSGAIIFGTCGSGSINWDDLSNVPVGFADDVDNDTQLSDAQLLDKLGNWSADQSNYYTKSESDGKYYFSEDNETDPLAYNGTLVDRNTLNNGSYFNQDTDLGQYYFSPDNETDPHWTGNFTSGLSGSLNFNNFDINNLDDLDGNAEIDIFPNNQFTRGLRMSDGTTFFSLQVLGSSYLKLADTFNVTSGNDVCIDGGNCLSDIEPDTQISDAQLLDKLGNWSADKSSYYTSSEIDSMNTSNNNYIAENNNSVNNYILYVNSTNGNGGINEEVDPYWEANWSAFNDTWSTDTDTNTNIIDDNLYNSSELEEQGDGNLGILNSFIEGIIEGYNYITTGAFDQNVNTTSHVEFASVNSTSMNTTSLFIDESSGNCDVSLSGNICRNSTGLYIVG